MTCAHGFAKYRLRNKCQVPFARNSLFGCCAQKVPDTYFSAIPKIKRRAQLSCLAFCWIVIGECSLAADVTVSPVFLNLLEQIQVPALVEGPIVSVQIKEGQSVAAGDLLARIDDQRPLFRTRQFEIENKIAAAKASNLSEILLAETELKVASANLQRALESRKKYPDTPSQAEVDELNLKVAQAQQHSERAKTDQQLAQLAQSLADSNLAAANHELSLYRSTAPISGVVVEVIAKLGHWVRPGEPIARIIRIDRLRVEGFAIGGKIAPGAKDISVTVVVDRSDRQSIRRQGKVVFVSPEVDPNDGRQRILAEIDNSKGELGPGLRASMIIHLP